MEQFQQMGCRVLPRRTEVSFSLSSLTVASVPLLCLKGFHHRHFVAGEFKCTSRTYTCMHTHSHIQTALYGLCRKDDKHKMWPSRSGRISFSNSVVKKESERKRVSSGNLGCVRLYNLFFLVERKKKGLSLNAHCFLSTQCERWKEQGKERERD